ncbi:MAG: hypothetical protein J6Z79_04075 [Clostridia bacterium]|nr:hypothetical protein [Clostridia bacterium]
MLKNRLKFAVVILILLCLVAAPVFGVSFYDSPSIFEENAFSTNRELGKGTSVFLKFAESEDEAIVEEEEPDSVPAETAETAETVESTESEPEVTTETETLKPASSDSAAIKLTDEEIDDAANALAERFKAIGYTDIVVEPAENDQIRVDIAQTSFIDSVMGEVAKKGEWGFYDPSQNVVCDATMVKEASIRTSQYGYFIRLDFTEEGAEQFKTKCSPLATSSGSAYFEVDGSFISIVSFSDITFGDSFTFGSYGNYGFNDYGTAALYCAMINEGALPDSMEIASTEPLAPTTPQAVILGMIALFIVAFLVFTVLYVLQGRTVGLFAAGALLGDVGLMLVFMANKAFQVNIATVIVLFVAMILAGLLFLYAVRPCGKALKEGKTISSALSGSVKKINIRALWIHAAIFALTIILWLTVQGTVVYVVRSVMIASLVNLGSYFLLFVFPAYTLSDVQQSKK